MRQGVVVEELHRDSGRQLLRRLEQPHQQRGPQEIIDHAITDPELSKQRQRIDRVVARVYRIAAVQIEHGVEQAGDAEPISNRQALEVIDRCSNLTQGTRPQRSVTEDRSRRLQAFG